MKSTISDQLPPIISSIDANLTSASFSVDFPNNINISCNTIQDKLLNEVGEEYTYGPVPLILKSIANKVDYGKKNILSTIQIGMKEYNTADPVERAQYEALERALKKYSKEALQKTVTIAADIVALDYTYSVDPPEYKLAPTWITYGFDRNEQREIPDNNVELINDPEIAAKPPQTGIISDFGMNYDMSGPTKTLEKSTYSQGLIRKQEVIIYGYAYTTFDPGVVTALGDGRPYYGASLQQFWRPVESYTITYKYKDNLYIGYIKIGTKYTRFAQEQDLEIYESDNDAVKSLYKFFNLPLIEVESISFDVLPDNGDGPPKCITKEIFDKETEKVKTIVIPNPDYKPSLYMKEKKMISRCFSKRAVPPDAPIASGIENQMISTGQENKLIEKTDIINNTGNPVTSTYRVYKYQESSQDADFKNNLKISGSEMFLGYPPQVSYINTKESIPNDEKPKYIVRAQVFSERKENMSTVNYPGAKSITEAFRKFVEDEDYNYISQMKGSESSLTLLGFHEAYPGNTVIVNDYEGILRSISYNVEYVAEGKQKVYTNMVLVKKPEVLPRDVLELIEVTNSANNECDSTIGRDNIEKDLEIVMGSPGRN